MKNPQFQQIANEGTALLAQSPFYFKPSGYAGVIPLLAIKAIVSTTREKDHALDMLFPGKSYDVIMVRLVGDSHGMGYELSLDDATSLVEKIRQLPQAIPRF